MNFFLISKIKFGEFMRYIKFIFIYILAILSYAKAIALSDNMSVFPLQNYSQDVNHWLPESNHNYNIPLLNKLDQQKRFIDLKKRYFGSSDNDYSPWSSKYVNYVLQEQSNKNIYDGESETISRFNNIGKNESSIGYGMNYRAYSGDWINTIATNMNVSQFKIELSYEANNRGILVDNVAVRSLPTDDPFYYSYKIAGNGYPFDILQSSSLLVGTPVYVIGFSSDKQWSLILSPEVIGWVKSNSIAYASDDFIKKWSQVAQHSLGAITQTNVSILDNNDNYRFSAYIGTMLPLVEKNKILIPVKNNKGSAEIISAYVQNSAVELMPLSTTPANFAKLLKQLVGRPYGWGGLGFYNDCSAELKFIYATFGIFMPRNSSQQIMTGNVVDISAKSLDERTEYLINNGRSLMTLVRIPGHIMLYIGAYAGKNTVIVPVVYNNIWGLSPLDRARRSIIGGSVFLPLLTQYPEDLSLAALLARPVLQLVYLDQLPNKEIKLGLSQLLYLS